MFRDYKSIWSWINFRHKSELFLVGLSIVISRIISYFNFVIKNVSEVEETIKLTSHWKQNSIDLSHLDITYIFPFDDIFHSSI